MKLVFMLAEKTPEMIKTGMKAHLLTSSKDRQRDGYKSVLMVDEVSVLIEKTPLLKKIVVGKSELFFRCTLVGGLLDVYDYRQGLSTELSNPVTQPELPEGTHLPEGVLAAQLRKPDGDLGLSTLYTGNCTWYGDSCPDMLQWVGVGSMDAHTVDYRISRETGGYVRPTYLPEYFPGGAGWLTSYDDTTRQLKHDVYRAVPDTEVNELARTVWRNGQLLRNDAPHPVIAACMVEIEGVWCLRTLAAAYGEMYGIMSDDQGSGETFESMRVSGFYVSTFVENAWQTTYIGIPQVGQDAGPALLAQNPVISADGKKAVCIAELGLKLVPKYVNHVPYDYGKAYVIEIDLEAGTARSLGSAAYRQIDTDGDTTAASKYIRDVTERVLSVGYSGTALQKLTYTEETITTKDVADDKRTWAVGTYVLPGFYNEDINRAIDEATEAHWAELLSKASAYTSDMSICGVDAYVKYAGNIYTDALPNGNVQTPHKYLTGAIAPAPNRTTYYESSTSFQKKAKEALSLAQTTVTKYRRTYAVNGVRLRDDRWEDRVVSAGHAVTVSDYKWTSFVYPTGTGYLGGGWTFYRWYIDLYNSGTYTIGSLGASSVVGKVPDEFVVAAVDLRKKAVVLKNTQKGVYETHNVPGVTSL